MTDCVANNNNIIKQYKFTNTELRNIIKKERIIKNLNVTKTEISRANKTTLINIITEYNIDVNNYYNDIEFDKSLNKFIEDGRFYNWGNNIHKLCKHRKLRTILYKNKFCIY
jgi:hypothetical protein